MQLACVLTLLGTIGILYVLASIIGGSFADFAEQEKHKVEVLKEKSMGTKLNEMGNQIIKASHLSSVPLLTPHPTLGNNIIPHPTLGNNIISLYSYPPHPPTLGNNIILSLCSWHPSATQVTAGWTPPNIGMVKL